MTKPQAPANTVATAKPSPFLTHLADAARRHGHTCVETAAAFQGGA